MFPPAAYYPFNELPCNSTLSFIIPWNNGILIAYPDATSNCTTSRFSFFNPLTSSIETSFNFPSVANFLASSVVPGSGNDVWVSSFNVDSSYNELYYCASGSLVWDAVNLQPVTSCAISSLVWDSSTSQLLLYIIDLTAGRTKPVNKLISVKANNPPNGSTLLRTSPVATFGTVNGLASVANAGSVGAYPAFPPFPSLF